MWTEHELDTRDSIIKYCVKYLAMELAKTNAAFRFIRIETPILVDHSLRTSTLIGSLEASIDILRGKSGTRQKLPVVIWQHGKVFEPLREVYTLEFHVLYSKTTIAAYRPVLIEACLTMLRKHCGTVFVGKFIDDGFSTLYAQGNPTPLITIREGSDFESGNNIEIIMDLDSCTEASIRHEVHLVS